MSNFTKPSLTQEQEQALVRGHGFVHGDSYVLISWQMFREIMGIGTDEELAASLTAIEEGLADIEAGRTFPMEQVLRELDEKYGVQG